MSTLASPTCRIVEEAGLRLGLFVLPILIQVAMKEVAEDNGLKKCVRYMEKRIQYMDYLEATEKGLPIGSGEIESSHRHVVQKRLEIAGAWWKTENTNAMLELRTARANGYWQDYWKGKRAA